jgi:signal transduction histidine kinase
MNEWPAPGHNGTVNKLMAALTRDRATRALAFARAAQPRTVPSRRSVTLDAALAAAVGVASLATIVTSYVTAGAVASVVVTTAPLALRRIRPLTAFWVVFVGACADAILTSSYVNTFTIIAILLAGYSAVAHSKFRGAALISVPLAGLIAAAMFPDTNPPLPARFAALCMLVPTALVGNAVQMWRRQAGDSQARLRHAQAEHQAATVRALAAERARIASELHDVVTHNVSVMVVQAGAARRVLTASPGEARAALLAVEASGRAAMTELQHLLGLLSPVDGMQAQAGQHSADQNSADQRSAETLRPQPGLGQLRPLIDRVTAAGLLAELMVSGPQQALPPGVDLAAYRVIQEALTNVMKHAPGSRTTVRLEYRADELVVNVSDDGRPGAQALNRPDGRNAARPANKGPLGGSGRGLLGLRERVYVYGGEFDAGPRPAGGWSVTARLLVGPPPGYGAGGDPDRQGELASVPART